MPAAAAGRKRRARFVEFRSKPVLTRNGRCRISRRCYECRCCGTAITPFKEALGVTGQERTLAVHEAITTVGCGLPFIPAKSALKDLTGLDESDRTSREVTELAKIP